MASRALVIGGLTSGSGKTTLTLGLLRALADRGFDVGAAKSGPDYIDCAFLAAASRAPTINLDSHAMSPPVLRRLAAERPQAMLVIEGVMGLFDGTHGGSGSTAQLAACLGAPVLLVLDTRHQGQTAAALAAGIETQLPAGTSLAGVVLNRIASPRHEELIRESLDARNITCFGSLKSDSTMSVPSRHLGLVQAADLAAQDELEPRIDAAARLVAESIDLEALIAATAPLAAGEEAAAGRPPGQRIAAAHDAAFGFAYTHMLEGWKRAGAEIRPFSPLADERPDHAADFIFLPGGYPELHLPTLSANARFLNGLRDAAARGVRIYGECGGYMTLGETIIDADSQAFRMAGLLSLETSFAARKLHLGYRRLTPLTNVWPGPDTVTGHEFHYTTALRAEGTPLFTAQDAAGRDLGEMGLCSGPVSGSYAHVII